MSEAEALRLDDMFRRSIRKEGLKEGENLGLVKGKKIGLEEGKSIGIEENKKEIIKNLLLKNMPYKDISDVTNKSINEIIKIKETL